MVWTRVSRAIAPPMTRLVSALTNLVIGGAIARETLVQTINEHPADQFGAVAKSTVVQVIESIPLDIDTDGDGELDGISVGMKGAAIPASFIEN